MLSKYQQWPVNKVLEKQDVGGESLFSIKERDNDKGCLFFIKEHDTGVERLLTEIMLLV